MGQFFFHHSMRKLTNIMSIFIGHMLIHFLFVTLFCSIVIYQAKKKNRIETNICCGYKSKKVRERELES